MELRLDRLTKEYGSKIAVDDFSYSMHEGVYGLLGANGAGKTTLMRMICDIQTPTRGEVICDNYNIREMGEEYRNLLGYLPQDFGYYPNFTAEKFLLYMSSLKGLDKRFAKRPGGRAFGAGRPVSRPEEKNQDILRRHEAEAGDCPGAFE